MVRLVLDEPDADRASWPLRNGSNGVGRAVDNPVWINRDNVSRYHAEILLMPVAGRQRAFLKDLGSSNGSFVNGTATTLAELADGDRVHFGTTRCRFEAPADETSDVQDWAAGLPAVHNRASQPGSDAPFDPSRSVIMRPGTLASDPSQAKLRILLEIGRSLSALQRLDDLLERALVLLFEHMAVDRATILLRTADDTLEPIDRKSVV